jgi:hypothetical protein
MVLPGILGSWIDHRLNTTVCEPTGFILGFLAGLAALIRIAATRQQKKL